MKVIVNCDEPNCPKRWDALDGCGVSHLSFGAECFHKVQLVDTHDAVHGVHQLGRMNKDILHTQNINKFNKISLIKESFTSASQ